MELFRRLHLSTLWQRKLSTVLVILGSALGTATLCAVALLIVSIGRPFNSLADAIAGVADIQVSPIVADRLPEDTIRQVRATEGVDVAVPVVGGLTTMYSQDGAQGALVAGTDCSLEEVVPAFDCTTRMSDLAPGSGVALVLSEPLASALQVKEGEPLAIPGRNIGAAHVGAIVDSDVVGDVNAGSWALGAVPDVQDLLDSGPNLTLVLARSGDPSAASTLRNALAGTANITSPGVGTGVFVTLTRGLLAFAGVLVLVSGVMIAANSFTLSLDDRRKSLAVVEVLGSSPGRTVTSLCAEGLLLGMAGGALAAYPAYLLGAWLTDRIGAEILQGTGARLETAWSWWLPAVTVLVGAGAGVAAAVVPAIRMVRTGSLVAIREQGGILPVHQPPRWPSFGILLVAIGAPLVWLYGVGRAPLLVALAGVAIATAGIVLAMFGITPWVVSGLNRAVGDRSVSGLLAGADLIRDPIRMAAVVTTVGLGIAVAVGAITVTELTSRSLGTALATEAGNRIYVFPRTNGADVSNRFDAQAVDAIEAVPGVGAVVPQYLAVLDEGVNGINVQGTDPAPQRRRGNLDFPAGTDEEAVWARVQDGDAIVSRVLANHLSVGVGDNLSLPGSSGEVQLRVAAVAQPRFAQDNGIADVVVVSQVQARREWAASVDFVIAEPDGTVPVGELTKAIETESGVAGLHALDAGGLRVEANRTARRFLGPVALIGYTLVVIAALAVVNFLLLGMLQRRRLRAVLSFVGFSPSVERRTLILQALAMGIVGGLFGCLGAQVYAWLTTLGSPALLASPVPWHLLLGPLGIGMVLAIGSCLLATIPPGLEAGNLDALTALVDD